MSKPCRGDNLVEMIDRLSSKPCRGVSFRSVCARGYYEIFAGNYIGKDVCFLICHPDGALGSLI